jgi:hypothetical protein
MGVQGVDMRGRNDQEELSVRGWQRAGALVGSFQPAGDGTTSIARPRSLYAAGIGGDSTSVRAPHTLQPLSERLQMPVCTQFAKGEERALVQAILEAPGPVLVAWEHGRGLRFRQVPQLLLHGDSATPIPLEGG